MVFDCLVGQFGSVIIATEVTQPYVAEVTFEVGCQKLSSLSVAYVSASGSDALFEVIGVTARAKHLFVVIALDNEVVGFGEIGGHLVGEFTNISCESHFVRAKLNVVARVVLAIVRHVKRCETEIFYLKRNFFFDNTF